MDHLLMNNEVYAKLTPEHDRSLGLFRSATSRPFAGVGIVQSPHIPKHPKKWVFPNERFWTYEASDEDWCRAVGLGHEEDDKDQLVVWAIKQSRVRAIVSDIETDKVDGLSDNLMRHMSAQMDRTFARCLTGVTA